MNWANVKAVFSEAVEVEAAARAGLVHARCAGDMALEEEVFSLLAAHDRESGVASVSGSTTNGVLETAAGHLGLATERPGTQVGAYLLEELIGEGGFGSVFRAMQQRPVRREVALKVIKLGMDTREVVARFEHERQTLALMDHAGIARVFDAGATATGRPYFVMELVRGEPITAFCTRQNLDVRQRVQLVRDIALAVQHAHSKGIIHRDLKPSNILVSSVDGSPAAKVIDFGIAKATVAVASAFHTEHRGLIGTPEYMAPEQADTASADVDIRTDVYALGTLLYELLAGQTPFDAMRLRRAGLVEIQRILREEEPLPPGTRISRQAAQPQTQTDGAPPPVTRPSVPRDLDWVVMKCLEKDRTRRYESAGALAADLSRFLAREPVAAAPPSVRYRLGKFVARRRALVTGISIASLALLIGVTIAGAALVKAAAAGRAAQSEAVKAVAVQRFMVKMLGQGDLTNTDGRDLPMSEVLDDAARDIDRGELADQPLVEAAVRLALSRAYLSISRLDSALAQARESVRLRRQHLPPDHLDLAESLRTQAFIGQTAGDETECVLLLQEAIRIMERDPANAPELASSYMLLGSTLFASKRVDEARDCYQKSVDRCIARSGPDSVQTRIAQTKLALIAHDPIQGLAVAQSAVDGIQAEVPGNSPQLASSLSDLGGIQQMRGDFEGSLATYQRALDVYVAIYGENNGHSVEIMNRVVWTHDMAGRADAARDMARRTIEVARRTMPRTSLRYYGYLITALHTYVKFGVDDYALDLAADGLTFAAMPFSTPANVLQMHLILVEGDIAAGRYPAATQRLQTEVEPLIAPLPPANQLGPRVYVHWLQGRLLEAQGQPASALDEFTPVATAIMEDPRAVTRIRLDVLDRLTTIHRALAPGAATAEQTTEHTRQADRYAAKAQAIRDAIAR